MDAELLETIKKAARRRNCGGLWSWKNECIFDRRADTDMPCPSETPVPARRLLRARPSTVLRRGVLPGEPSAGAAETAGAGVAPPGGEWKSAGTGEDSGDSGSGGGRAVDSVLSSPKRGAVCFESS